MRTITVIIIPFYASFIYCFLNTNTSFENEEPAMYKSYLSTKTPYRFIENKIDSEIRYKGCNANRIWSVVRHGTRTPGTETADLIRGRLVQIRDLIVTYCKNKDVCRVSDFNKWTPHKELDDKKRLTHIGEDELIDLGGRFGNRFPSILPGTWDNTTYLIRYTDTTRAKASAAHFAIGLFGKQKASEVWYPEPLKKDPILRFYKLCEKWRKDVKKNPETLVELRKFLKSDVANVIVRNVAKRFEIPDGILNMDDIQLMYTACCFETAWDKRENSPWCDVFSVDEFKALEYAEDLEYYWIDGYGHELTTKMGCVMMRDVINHLTNENGQRAVLYFTHSGTILKFLSHLGLYRDEIPLRHDNFEQSGNRLWRTSKIDVFGSNIAFILFDCTNGKHILTLHQERPVTLPGCPIDSDLCPLDTVREIYKESLTNCEFEKICSSIKDDEPCILQSLNRMLRAIFHVLVF